MASVAAPSACSAESASGLKAAAVFIVLRKICKPWLKVNGGTAHCTRYIVGRQREKLFFGGKSREGRPRELRDLGRTFDDIDI